MECIVLAGGLGTRLKGEVGNLPKCMAPINELPFLAYVLDYLESQFVDQVILSLGYQHQIVTEWLNTKGFTFKLQKVIEQEPLGTGGGIRLAMKKSKEKEVFVLNGDTIFDVNLREMKKLMDPETKVVLALKPLQDFDRYGSIKIDKQNNIISFEEKQARTEGLINGGVYLLNREQINFEEFPQKFSFEKDFLEQQVNQNTLKGFISDKYFIDIGVPEDFHRAQKELISQSR